MILTFNYFIDQKEQLFVRKMGEEAVHPKEGMENGLNTDHSEEPMSEGEDDEDFADMPEEEVDAINKQLDDINSALDVIEEKNDSIFAQFLKLQQANREIRAQMQACAANGKKENEPA